jgi:hypothetical protein
MNQSPRFSLEQSDIERWLQNSKVFLAPLGLIYLAFVSANLSDGFSLSDLVPNAVVMGAIALYVVNSLTDLLRKLIAGK